MAGGACGRAPSWLQQTRARCDGTKITGLSNALEYAPPPLVRQLGVQPVHQVHVGRERTVGGQVANDDSTSGKSSLQPLDRPGREVGAHEPETGIEPVDLLLDERSPDAVGAEAVRAELPGDLDDLAGSLHVRGCGAGTLPFLASTRRWPNGPSVSRAASQAAGVSRSAPIAGASRPKS